MQQRQIYKYFLSAAARSASFQAETFGLNRAVSVTVPEAGDNGWDRYSLKTKHCWSVAASVRSHWDRGIHEAGDELDMGCGADDGRARPVLRLRRRVASRIGELIGLSDSCSVSAKVSGCLRLAMNRSRALGIEPSVEF